MAVVVTTPPSALVIDVTTARARLGLDASVTDLTLAALMGAATGMLDGPGGTLGRAVLPQTLELRMPGWGPLSEIDLPFPPAASIVSITYADPTGVDVILPASAYRLQVDGDEARVIPLFGTAWPAAFLRPDSIRIRYVAGYQDAQGKPAPPPGLLQAILMMTRNLASLGTRDAFLRSEQVTGIGSTSYDTGAGGGASTQAVIDALLSPHRVPSL